MSTATASSTWFEQIANAFSSPGADHYKLVADLFKTVPLANLPRPGDASSWNLEEWRSWGLANGFYEEDKKKHGTAFINSTFSRLRYARSDSGGDFRASMRLATDIKRLTRTVYERVASIVIHHTRLLVKGDPSTKHITMLDDLLGAVKDAENGGLNDDQIQDLLSLSRAGHFADSEEVRRVAKVIEREFNLSLKQCLTRIMPREEGERAATLLKESPAFQIHADELAKLVDLLEQLRADEAGDKEAKRREREAREKEREERDSVRLAVQTVISLTPQQIQEATIAEARRKLQGGVQSALDIQSMLFSKLRTLDDLVRTVQFPTAPTEDTARVTELEKQVRVLTLDRDTIRNVHAEQSQQLTDARKELTELMEVLNAPNQFKERYDEVVKLVEPIAGSRDMFAIVSGLTEVARVLAKHREG